MAGRVKEVKDIQSAVLFVSAFLIYVATFPHFAGASLSPYAPSGGRFLLSPEGWGSGKYSFTLSLKGVSRGAFFAPGPFGVNVDITRRAGFFLFGDLPSLSGPFDVRGEELLGFGVRTLFLNERETLPSVGCALQVKNITSRPDGKIALLLSKLVKKNDLLFNAGYAWERDAGVPSEHFALIGVMYRRSITHNLEVSGELASWISKSSIPAISAGAQFFLTRHFSLILYLEGHLMNKEPDGSITLSLAYHNFDEKERDSDGDGIYNFKDSCPFNPEDFDGFQDSDGCPDPDNDGDGIPDWKDPTPNGEREIEKKFEKPYPTFKLRIP